MEVEAGGGANHVMTRRPVYRRVSFWLGLFVACFLGWGWWDSYRRCPGFAWERGGKAVIVLRMDGVTGVTRGPSDAMKIRRGSLSSMVMTARAALSWEKLWKDAGSGAGVRFVRIPDGVVFAGWLVVWGGWMGWRWWRERKAECRVISDP
ncbi:hypothetical protein [Luteolibacter soli]